CARNWGYHGSGYRNRFDVW
nr:immunoglobulin heavy chain junction region [Macaca mulatta]MOW86536.1 immunoglobulin heavy chain junction region [Macaca mulatta]MOW86580.1 immunoglobulin heavy chain junction region [Macaca mulatta]MOW87321.1 immunoglobulin heavy chain junction region [Macaca mulatta]MOW87486.1 immunoglobulin heavy chain junction region [Macaca mulatta]